MINISLDGKWKVRNGVIKQNHSNLKTILWINLNKEKATITTIK